MAPSRLDARPIGPQHPRIRELLALRKDASAGRIMVEGGWEHDQLLDTPTTIDTFFYCPEAGDARTADVAARVAARATEAYRISEKLLARLTRRGRPDGLISIARLPVWQPDDFSFDESSLVLVADGVEYAGNLGTLIRTVDACRADCLVLTSRRARLTHPTVYAASRGMVLTTPVLEFDAIPDAAEWLRPARVRRPPRGSQRDRELPRDGVPGETDGVRGRLGRRRAVEDLASAGVPGGVDPDARAGRLAQRRAVRRDPPLRGPRPQGRLVIRSASRAAARRPASVRQNGRGWCGFE